MTVRRAYICGVAIAEVLAFRVDGNKRCLTPPVVPNGRPTCAEASTVLVEGLNPTIYSAVTVAYPIDEHELA